MPLSKREPGDDSPGDARRPHVEEGDAVRVHEAYIENRLGGGEPPGPEAYQRAIEQFERLPGAMRTTPSATPQAAPQADEGNDAQGLSQDDGSQGDDDAGGGNSRQDGKTP
jgi:hypothetical protein